MKKHLIITLCTIITLTAYTEPIIVNYSNHGAKGDGITDDFEAIYQAHKHANKLRIATPEKRVIVRGTPNANYFIGAKHSDRTILIQTSTDWTDVTFTIDDREVPHQNARVWLFRVESALPEIDLFGTVTSLKAGQPNIPEFSFERDMMITVADNTTLFHRKEFGGDGPFAGGQPSPKIDAFRIDKQGNIDPLTPIVHDFNTITSLRGIQIDEETLTIRGGTFIRYANLVHVTRGGYGFGYFDRGILVTRSNVVMEGLYHDVRYYNLDGSPFPYEQRVRPYSGFINTRRCSDITIRNVVLSGRRMAEIGTYDLLIETTLNILLENVNQTNCINDRRYWGIMASNESKNIVVDRVSFSRFDTHRLVHNITVKNSEIGYASILATGSGTLWVENTTVYASFFMSFREDWGSHWNGNVYVKNSVFAPFSQNVSNMTVFSGFNITGKFDFGFPNTMPKIITIDGLTIDDSNLREGGNILLFNNVPNSSDQPFPFGLTEEVRIRNLNIKSGRNFIIPSEALKQNLRVVRIE